MGKTNESKRTLTCLACSVIFEPALRQRRKFCDKCTQKWNHCAHCDKTKPAEEFNIDRDRPTGRQTRCRDCKTPGSVCRRCGAHHKRKKGSRIWSMCPECVAVSNRCYTCKEYKDHSEFNKDSTAPGGLSGRCRTCSHAHSVELRYKLPADKYKKMLADQGNVCAICLQPPPENRPNLCVDHCHSTGRVRALLCSNCNSAIGHLRDNVPVILRAADYVFNHSLVAEDEDRVPQRPRD